MQSETSTESRGFHMASDDTKARKIGLKNKGKLSKIAILLEKHTSTSSMTQREIADAVGFKNQNMITMIKQGDAKLPIDRVPAMARVLGLDPLQLFNMALEQFYTPEAIKDLQAILPPVLSAPERELINLVREAGKNGKQLTLERLQQVRDILA